MRHLIEPADFSDAETLAVLNLADRISVNPSAYAHVADGKVLATLFYEPSTRTRLSFESAMLHLGGRTLGFSGAEQSSATKAKPLPTRHGSSAVMRTSLLCVIPRKALRCWPPGMPPSR